MAANIKYRTGSPSVPNSTSVKGSPLTNEEIDGNFKSLSDELALVESGNSTTNSNLSTLSGTVTTLSGTVTTVQGNVSTNTGNISSLQTLTSTQTSDISNLQQQVSSISSNSVTLNSVQTLTNKTLTSPVLNLPTINGFTGNTTEITIGSNQFVKDVSGNIGLGVVSPAWKLDVAGTNPGIRVKDESNALGLIVQQVASGNAYINLVDNKDLIINTNNIERIRFTAQGDTQTSGRIGVGKIPSANLDYREQVYVISGDTQVTQQRTYILTASANITLPPTPVMGDWVRIINSSNTVTPTLLRNGSNIMGFAEDMTVNVMNANLTLTYVDASKGWVIS